MESPRNPTLSLPALHLASTATGLGRAPLATRPGGGAPGRAAPLPARLTRVAESFVVPGIAETRGGG